MTRETQPTFRWSPDDDPDTDHGRPGRAAEPYGRVALVTGAGQGVGEAIASMLAGQGAAVAVNDYFAERAERVAARITDAGGRAHAAPADVCDPRAVASMIADVECELGPVDILVNNAGNAGAVTEALKPLPKFWESTPEDWEPGSPSTTPA